MEAIHLGPVLKPPASVSATFGALINTQCPSLPVPNSTRCTRVGCGRVCEGGREVCEGCEGGSSRPVQGNAIASSSTAKPATKPSVNCISCHVPLDVPSRYQSSYILCPPCQSRNAALKVKPTNGNVNGNHERTVPQANPYPVVRSITTTSGVLAHSVGFLYAHPPAFSSLSSSATAPAPAPAPFKDANANTNATDRVNMAALRQGADMLRVCMRFGCGARLPAHSRREMCETCAGAGFSRPPPAPPMVLPKRVPRRAKERTRLLPRESFDLGRASLLREAVEKAKAASAAAVERKYDDDYMDVDLVYPEVIPESSPPTRTPSESKTEEPKPTEDEKIADVDLELMYPEDAEKDARKRSATSLTPPTSLRELVSSGLKIIPTLDDVAVPVDDRPQRQCQTPGCNEVLSSHTCMQRCVKCCLSAWRERKKAVTEDPGPSRRPSAISLISSTDSAEAREVATMLEETSDAEAEERDPLGTDLPPPSSSPSKGSSETERYIPGWDSDLTELSDSDDSDPDSDSDADPEPDLDAGLNEKPGDSNSLKIRIPLLIYRLPSHTHLRKCSYKGCNIALPKDDRWKACAACRRAQNEYQKNRHRKLRNMLGFDPLKSPDLSTSRWRSLSPDPEVPKPILTLENSRPCSANRCRIRIPLPEVYKWKTCTRCRSRARHKARRKRDALIDTMNASHGHEVIPRFQAYQHRSALMGSFEAQLRGFVEGQIVFLRAKLAECGWRGGEGGAGADGGGGELWKPKIFPMAFGFAGEYSIISGPRGASKGGDGNGGEHPRSLDPLEAMRKEVSVVVSDLERVLRAKFKSGEAFAIESGGIMMRFTCSLELLAQLRPLSPSPSVEQRDADKGASGSGSSSGSLGSTIEDSKGTTLPTAVPLVKTLSGELEAAIVPDESHRWYYGRRTVVRFGMVG